MGYKLFIEEFAELLIRQKKKIRSIQNLLMISFICLSLGILLALPLRYYRGISFEIPLLILLIISVLAFIYGFLGVEKKEEILRETDTKLKLNEKLSAAYQFADSDNPYSSLLENDAVAIINELQVKKIYKIRFSRRDPFQPLLLALFLFLWLSSFSFLQVSNENKAIGEMLVDTGDKIDTVTGDSDDKDIEDISEEYKKLGQRIQDRFMNDAAIEDEVEKLSRKLEKKIESLSREGVNKESQTLSDEETESEVFQLNRKTEMSNELGDILQSLMKTFSLSQETAPGGIRRGDGSESGDGEQRPNTDNKGENTTIPEEKPDEESLEGSNSEDSTDLEAGDSESLLEKVQDGSNTSREPGDGEGKEKDDASGNEPSPSFSDETDEDEMSSNYTPGNEVQEEHDEYSEMKEEKQSGEFDDENIRAELQDGEQMKSFIRALPHIVEPTLDDMEIIHFYRYQLETAIEKEVLPEGYESVIRDYFLSIGVLNE